jgi:hypothetical protein
MQLDYIRLSRVSLRIAAPVELPEFDRQPCPHRAAICQCHCSSRKAGKSAATIRITLVVDYRRIVRNRQSD